MFAVAAKDVLDLLRRRRMAVLYLVFVVVLGLVTLLSWPQQGIITLDSAGRDQLLLGLLVGQLLLLCLAVPGVAAPGICGELEADTLEMLYASRLSPMEIVGGKLVSALMIPMLLLAAGLPFAAMLVFRGDVEMDRLLTAYGLLLLSGVLLATGSLAVSALSRQVSSAMVYTYGLLIVVAGVSLVPGAILLGTSNNPLVISGLHYLRSLSPLGALLSLLRPELIDPMLGTGSGLTPLWRAYVAAAVGVIVISMLIVTWRLHRPPKKSADTGNRSELIAKPSKLRRLMFLMDDSRMAKPASVWNPLLTKESRTNATLRGPWMVRLLYVSVLAGLGLAWMSLSGGTEHKDLLAQVASLLVAFQFMLVMLVGPSFTSPALCGERERGTFEMLRMSRLSAGQIFWGKLLPALPPAALPALALLPAYGAIIYVDPTYLVYFSRIAPVLVGAIALCCVAGLTVSAFARTATQATVLSYLIVSALFVLPAMVWWAMGSQQIAIETGKWLCLPSPMVMALNLLTPSEASILPVAALANTHVLTIGIFCLLGFVIARAKVASLLSTAI